MSNNPFAWSPGPTDRLIRRAEREFRRYGIVYLDTRALLAERGVDVNALLRDLNNHNGDGITHG